MSTKLNIEFGPEANAILAELAKTKGTSKSEIIRRAINVYSFLEQQTEKNKASIVIRPADGPERELLVT